MKKILNFISRAIVATVLLFPLNSIAQTTPANKFNAGFGVEVGVPEGDATQGSTFTLGGTARLQYGVTDNFALTFTTGGYHFFPKFAPGTNIRYGSFGELPIRGGVKFFVAPGIYLGGEAGIEFEIYEHGWGPHRLDLSPNLGYANKHWDAGLHYERFTRTNESLGLLGIRIAYGFGL